MGKLRIMKFFDKIYVDLYTFSKAFSSSEHARFLAGAFTGFFAVSNFLIPVMIGFIVFSTEIGIEKGGLCFGILALVLIGLFIFRYESGDTASVLLEKLKNETSNKLSVFRGALISFEVFAFPVFCIWILIQLIGDQ